jgi:hypothetical protein
MGGRQVRVGERGNGEKVEGGGEYVGRRKRRDWGRE